MGLILIANSASPFLLEFLLCHVGLLSQHRLWDPRDSMMCSATAKHLLICCTVLFVVPLTSWFDTYSVTCLSCWSRLSLQNRGLGHVNHHGGGLDHVKPSWRRFRPSQTIMAGAALASIDMMCPDPFHPPQMFCSRETDWKQFHLISLTSVYVSN